MMMSSFFPFPLDSFVKWAEPPDEPAANGFDASQFTATELRVIDLAQREDTTRYASSRGWFGWDADQLRGSRRYSPLPDPRLESLRVFSSLARHRCDCVEEGDVTRLIDMGFSRDQVHALLNHLQGLCSNAHSGAIPCRKAVGYCGPELG
ncbi:hypothetical protein [Novosphingobium kaempferiae]|uniref:hypothetical protein n=1 Tax=Novosphingobium kaempferiae TaxID=2896849 RepID=UPI001E48E9E8|nr:hypothetical protein [Novosphingobium kaempferiae]